MSGTPVPAQSALRGGVSESPYAERRERDPGQAGRGQRAWPPRASWPAWPPIQVPPGSRGDGPRLQAARWALGGGLRLRQERGSGHYRGAGGMLSCGTHTHAHTGTRMHMQAQMHTHTHMHMQAHVHTHTHPTHTCTCTHTHTQAHACTHMHMQAHVHKHTHMRARTPHTHMYTYAHAGARIHLAASSPADCVAGAQEPYFYPALPCPACPGTT